MSSVDELLAFAAIACVLKKKERKRRRLWRKEWWNRNNYTHINEGRSLNSSINSDKNSFDHVAVAERREKDDISLCTWRLD
jgi:predicted transcriptional regulator YdeE